MSRRVCINYYLSTNSNYKDSCVKPFTSDFTHPGTWVLFGPGGFAPMFLERSLHFLRLLDSSYQTSSLFLPWSSPNEDLTHVPFRLSSCRSASRRHHRTGRTHTSPVVERKVEVVQPSLTQSFLGTGASSVSQRV